MVRERLMPSRRNTWFTVSAIEWPASANIAALPVSAPATSLQKAIARLAAMGARTAPRLSSPELSGGLGASFSASFMTETKAPTSDGRRTSDLHRRFQAPPRRRWCLGAGQLLSRAKSQQVRPEFVVALPLEVPVVYRQVAELSEVAGQIARRCDRA